MSLDKKFDSPFLISYIWPISVGNYDPYVGYKKVIKTPFLYDGRKALFRPKADITRKLSLLVGATRNILA